MGKLINIDGSKLKALLESATGKSLATLGVENGYSKSILTNAVRRNTASPAVVALVRLYGIEPSAYEVKEVTTLRAIEAEKERKQLTLDDLVRDDVRAELKEIFKEIFFEAFGETLNGAVVIPAPQKHAAPTMSKDILLKDSGGTTVIKEGI